MEIKVVVAGLRNYNNYSSAKNFIDEVLSDYKDDTITILSGGCTGADMLGERYAKEHDLKIIRHNANWKLLGKSAGPIRNRKMARECDLVICFWDGKSPGTKNMIQSAREFNKPVKIKLVFNNQLNKNTSE